MKHLKLYENFKINEADDTSDATAPAEDNSIDTGKVFPEASITSDGKLTLKIEDLSLDIQMKNISSFKGNDENFSGGQKAFNQKTKQWFDVDTWIIPVSEVRKQLASNGFDFKAFDYQNKSLNDDSRNTEAYLFIGVPKGYDGQIKADSSKISENEGIGYNKGKGGLVFTSPATTHWGFYFLEEYKKDHRFQNVFRKMEINRNDIPAKKKEPIEPIIIQSDFEMDSSELNQNMKNEIKSKIDPSKVKGVFVLTGASQDADPNEMIEKDGKEIKRGVHDTNLVKARYKNLMAYLKEIGVESKVAKGGKNKKGNIKVYGVFDSGNKKAEKNRQVALKVISK